MDWPDFRLQGRAEVGGALSSGSGSEPTCGAAEYAQPDARFSQTWTAQSSRFEIAFFADAASRLIRELHCNATMTAASARDWTRLDQVAADRQVSR